MIRRTKVQVEEPVPMPVQPQAQAPANPPVVMRRNPPKMVRTTIVCYWPCPCGGTVPGAPSWCDKRKKYSDRARVFCVDVLICMECADNEVCEAYLKYCRRYPEFGRRRAF